MAQLRSLAMRIHSIRHPNDDRMLTQQDLLAVGCGREEAQQILALLSQEQALHSYLSQGKLYGCTALTRASDDYPAIIRPNEKLIAALRMMKEMGYELILWTCRGCDDLDEAVVWLREQGLNFELVNENSPAIIEYFDFDSRKIFADEYWDDKAAEATVE